MKEVLKCLCSRATKPSPLKPCLRLLELQRLHSTLTSEALTSIAESELRVWGVVKESLLLSLSLFISPDLSNCHHVTGDSSTTLVEQVCQDPSEGTLDLSGTLSVTQSSSGSVFSPGEGGEPSPSEAARATPPIVTQLMDMGFLRAQVNVALSR